MLPGKAGGMAMLLVAGGLVCDHDGNTDRPTKADILVDAGQTVAVGRNLVAGMPGVSALDAHNRLVLAGFVDAHYHLHDALLKGFFEAIPVEPWFLATLGGADCNVAPNAICLPLRRMLNKKSSLWLGATHLGARPGFMPCYCAQQRLIAL